MEASKLHYDSILYTNPATNVTIYSGTLLASSLPVIIKTQQYSSLSLANQSISEAMSQASLAHPHICKVWGCFLQQQGTECLTHIVLERMERDLKQEIDLRREENRPFTEEEVMGILWEAGTALAYAEKQGIAHRDIKPSNIFLCNGLKTVKIGDFGCAERSFTPQAATDTIAGTPLYLSPELKQAFLLSMRGERPDFSINPVKADVYSLGITMFAVVTLENPNIFANISDLQGVTRTALDKVAHFPRFSAFLAEMLRINPENRPTFLQLEQEMQPFFRETANFPCEKLCFACNSPIKSRDWQAYLPDDLIDINGCLDLCSWACLQQLHESKEAKSACEVCAGCGKDYSWPWQDQLSLKCGHFFHSKECFHLYFKHSATGQAVICPICREELPKELISDSLVGSECEKCGEIGVLSVCEPCKHFLCESCTRKSLSTGCIKCRKASLFGLF